MTTKQTPEARVAELEAALADRDATIARVEALHAYCFGASCATADEYPCPTAAALDGGAS